MDNTSNNANNEFDAMELLRTENLLYKELEKNNLAYAYSPDNRLYISMSPEKNNFRVRIYNEIGRGSNTLNLRFTKNGDKRFLSGKIFDHENRLKNNLFTFSFSQEYDYEKSLEYEGDIEPDGSLQKLFRQIMDTFTLANEVERNISHKHSKYRLESKPIGNAGVYLGVPKENWNITTDEEYLIAMSKEYAPLLLQKSDVNISPFNVTTIRKDAVRLMADTPFYYYRNNKPCYSFNLEIFKRTAVGEYDMDCVFNDDYIPIDDPDIYGRLTAEVDDGGVISKAFNMKDFFNEGEMFASHFVNQLAKVQDLKTQYWIPEEEQTTWNLGIFDSQIHDEEWANNIMEQLNKTYLKKDNGLTLEEGRKIRRDFEDWIHKDEEKRPIPGASTYVDYPDKLDFSTEGGITYIPTNSNIPGTITISKKGDKFYLDVDLTSNEHINDILNGAVFKLKDYTINGTDFLGTLNRVSEIFGEAEEYIEQTQKIYEMGVDIPPIEHNLAAYMYKETPKVDAREFFDKAIEKATTDMKRFGAFNMKVIGDIREVKPETKKKGPFFEADVIVSKRGTNQKLVISNFDANYTNGKTYLSADDKFKYGFFFNTPKSSTKFMFSRNLVSPLEKTLLATRQSKKTVFERLM